MPGTATPGEMEQAMAFGLEAVKFFPAEQNGGVAKLKAIAGPYKALKWMPTGGVSAKNLMDYLSFDQVVACGGTWMVKKDLHPGGETGPKSPALTREAVDTMTGLQAGGPCGSHLLNAEARPERIGQDYLRPVRPALPGGEQLQPRGDGGGVHQGPRPRRPRHIVIGTNSVERAIYHLERRGGGD